VAEFFQNAGGSLPFVLLLLALLGFRARVTPRASLHIAAPAEKVFGIVDLKDGDEQKWHRAHVSVKLIDPDGQIYRMRYATTLSTGIQQVSHADFRVAERDAPRRLVLDRAGLEGKSPNNQLMRIVASFEPEGEGTRFRLAYHWGPRPLISQLLARADILSGAHRMKSFAETGEAGGWAETLVTVSVAAVTGVVTLIAFGFWFGWIASFILVAALFVHEFGHLLAFRLIGQPWGRMVFLPFLGALAMPRLAYDTQAQSVFSALMGPGFSLIIPALATVAVYNGAGSAPLLVTIGLVASVLNLFNLLPVEPLDGGVALRSIFASLFGSNARFALMAVGAVICAAGIWSKQPLFLIFGGLSILANFRPRVIDQGLAPLSRLETAISIFSFVAIVGAYLAALLFLAEHRT
jgi:Zn-dependent protease